MNKKSVNINKLLLSLFCRQIFQNLNVICSPIFFLAINTRKDNFRLDVIGIYYAELFRTLWLQNISNSLQCVNPINSRMYLYLYMSHYTICMYILHTNKTEMASNNQRLHVPHFIATSSFILVQFSCLLLSSIINAMKAMYSRCSQVNTFTIRIVISCLDFSSRSPRCCIYI